MARPTPVKLSATTTQAQITGVDSAMPFRAFHVKNVGTADCLIDFDKDIDSNNSYLLEIGETITIDWPFQRVTYKTTAGTATLYVIKI